MSELYISLITISLIYLIYLTVRNHESYNINLNNKSYNKLTFQNDQSTFNPNSNVITIEEFWISENRRRDNIDSMVLVPNEGIMQVLATPKSASCLYIMNSEDGTLNGDTSSTLNNLQRPNGLTVLSFKLPIELSSSYIDREEKHTFILLTERDGKRVQVLQLPDYKSILTFGEQELERPYATATYFRKDLTNENIIVVDVFVTDGFMEKEWNQDKNKYSMSKIPYDRLRERIKQYQLVWDIDPITNELNTFSIRANYIKSFGDGTGEGRLQRVESIVSDEIFEHLLIADEYEKNIKVYNLDGKYIGIKFGDGIFTQDPEGIALHACSHSLDGYWITTDQRKDATHFHVFRRGTYRYLGTFKGRKTRHTDGIAVTQESFGPFNEGGLFASNDDSSISSFTWESIKDALNLKCNL